MPAIGLGTFGSDHVTGQEIGDAVEGAAEMGYRHFDCASVYSNEHLVGEALEAITRDGISRTELWINSKVWNDHHRPDDVGASCRQSLKDLRLDYLDLYGLRPSLERVKVSGIEARIDVHEIAEAAQHQP